ncbi:organic cation transporter protein isoform X2 [Cherax quadricarinatus]|uniref:organic cation transporter protein isoform X2 n=1 Tax=Cherax quadricarinatus TaxID=27406 RepID=UPI002378EDA9|nr:organic cation transporter protein-like [Cherax quadricarinatus]
MEKNSSVGASDAAQETTNSLREETEKTITLSEEEAMEETATTYTSSEAFQVLLHQVGDYGRWQWMIFFVTSSCGIFSALHNLSAAFLSATPDHWCQVPGLDGVNITFDLRNVSIPWEAEGEAGVVGRYSSCSYYDRNWKELAASGAFSGDTLPDLPTNVSTTTCNHWHYDHSTYKTTVVEEWDLVCDRRYLASTVQSVFMAGVFAGAVVLSELSDRYGRRTVSLVSSVGILVSSLCVSFMTHYVPFILLRFFMGFFNSGIFLPNFVILMEVVGAEGRTVMGMLYQSCFSLGFMLLPGIAYFVREWRQLELCISVPCVLLLLNYWLLPESPRWLMMQGRDKEAMKILKKMAKINGGKKPMQKEVDALVAQMNKEKRVSDEKSVTRNLLNLFQSIITLLSTRNMRRRCLIIFFAWFVVSLVYYGLTFNGANINASIYLLIFFSGLVELPSYCLVCWTLQKFGRRVNLCTLFVICGAACLLILAVPKDMVWLNMTLATAGKFFNSAAFAVAYIYSAELVPTGVRNISVGTSSMCARIGSILAPFIVDLLGELHYTAPSTVFGLFSIFAGLLALLLPETSKHRLPETVAEVEALPR